MIKRIYIYLLALMCGAVAAGAAPDMLIGTETGILKVKGGRAIAGRIPGVLVRDLHQLDNGNILFAFNTPGKKATDVECGVREISPDGKTVWEYKIDDARYIISCDRMKNGNTLIGASCKAALLIVNPAGKIVRTIPLRGKDKKHASTIVRELSTGNLLVAEEREGVVTEYTLDGQMVWEFQPPFNPFCVERLANGNTLVSGKDGLVEVTPAKEIIWQFTREEAAEIGPRWFASFRVRKNGNIVIMNPGGTVPVYEVNRAKKIVWKTPLSKTEIKMGHGLFLMEDQ
ncbi:hypothetical protein [Pontiella sulfatireligans]|nr:hypothetical protein [Pontiella sulfatireligans]